MTKHSIDIALKISSFFEKCQFSTLRYSANEYLRYSANEYVIYKDDITAETVQPPLFSYVTFAKVAKNAGITLQIIEILPYYHNKTGFKMKIYDIDYHSIHAFTD